MADEKTTAEQASTEKTTAPEVETREETAEATSAGAGPEGGPVPGDPSSEPVATAAQSHVAGRVGPPSIQQDEAAPWAAPEGVAQVAPGTVLDAAYPLEGGVVAQAVPDPATFGAGPYGGETPAPAAANVVTQTTPGDSPAGPDEMPPNTPQASDRSASGGPVTIPAASKGDKGTATSGATTAPASPRESSTSSTGHGSGAATELADSAGKGSGGGSAEGDERSDSASSAESGPTTSDSSADLTKRDTATDSSA